MTKISTEHFPAWLQYQSPNTDAVSKAELKENKEFKSLKNYIVGEWKTYLIKETEFYVESQNYRKSIILDNLTSGIDSIIFQKCVFDCEVTINLQSDKFKFIFFIDCTINQKVAIAGNIQDFLIIKDSKVNADLVFLDGSCVKEQILLSNSYFKNIKVENYFQSEKFSIIDDSKITNNVVLTGTKITEIQVHDSYIKGNFENSRNENQHNFDSQSLSFYKSKIGGNIEIKDNLKIKEVIFNEVAVTGYLKAICYGDKIIFNNKNSFKYISFQVNLKNIEIEKSELYGKFSIQEKSIVKYFHISASITYSEFFVEKSIINSLKIETNSILRSLNCEDVEINYISIEDTIFKGLVTTDLKQTEHLDIRDCKIYDNFHYSSSNTNKEKQLGFFLSNFFVEDSLSISDTNFQNITIENTIVGETLSISRISVDYDFSVHKLLCTDSFRIDGNSKLKNLSFNNLYTPQINIENVSIDSNKINFSNSHLDSLYHFDLPKYEYLFESCKIEKLHFAEKTNPKDNIYTFIKCDFSLIEISNFNNLGNLFFRSIKSKKRILQLQDFRRLLSKNIQNNDFLEFNFEEDYHKYLNWHSYSTDVKPTVIFNQSSLGKAEFTDFDFKGFDFYYNNSKITETFISGGTLPKTIEIHNLNKDDHPTDYYIQKVGAYNQFKKIFESQGDIFQSTYFQAKAAENQAILLEKQKNITISEKSKNTKWFIPKMWIWLKESFLSHNFIERITFCLNKYSNRHGESWGQALLFILGIGMLFFIPFRILSGKTEIIWNPTTEFLADFLLFIDPTQKIKEGTSNEIKILIFVSKIFIGYGIFQLIAAFRKHGKKGS